MHQNKIAILGITSWGVTLGNLLSENSNNVTLLSRNSEETDLIVKKRQIQRNIIYKLSKHISISNDYEKEISEANVILLVVPSYSIKENIIKISNFLSKDQIIISATKGFEYNSKKTISQYISENTNINKANIGVISGPNISSEIYKGLPSSTVIGIDKKHAGYLRNIFNSNKFRAYSSNDVIGIEMGGILKNIFAIGAGIIHEYNLGTNAMASYITRSLHEITNLSYLFGTNKTTVYGNSGLGDLITTCFNINSRNHKLGTLLAKGMNLEIAVKNISGVVEGIQTTKIIQELLLNEIYKYPITNEVYKVLFENKNPLNGIKDLMNREDTTE